MSKERGQIAWEAWNDHIGSAPDVRWAAIESAVRRSALEEAAKCAEEHGVIVSNEAVGQACSRNIAAAIRRLMEQDNG